MNNHMCIAAVAVHSKGRPYVGCLDVHRQGQARTSRRCFLKCSVLTMMNQQWALKTFSLAKPMQLWRSGGMPANIAGGGLLYPGTET